MYTNTDCTIYFYNKGQYTRQVIEDVFWSDTKQANVKETGLINADSVKLMIPISSANNLSFTLQKDIVVKGVSQYEIDNTSQKTISDSLTHIVNVLDGHSITSADDKRYGSPNMHHYDLSCK